ncbi:MAG: PorV/PorQ family protein, partial [Bacteroidetes bacterium]|nr:PorV/PorQ family protein [Bacteroidota bacterium]
MKNFYKYLVALFFIGIIAFPVNKVNAGNKDRVGQAGADELLINPWARSSGWGGANNACVVGAEGMFNNIAGMAFTPKTELIFSYTDWMRGADIKLMSFGLSQRVGESGVIGLSFVSLNFGEIETTTIELPDGGIGKFAPRYLNIIIGYAKAFSNSIYGGLSLKIISESIADASAQGVAIDAGIQYVTGEKENIKFGIALRNVGPKMKYSGDGFSLQSMVPNNSNQFTTTQRGASFELPTQLQIGASYDFLFSDDYRFTLAGNFVSNSFKKDQFIIGGEFSFKNYVLLRAGYAYEEGINKSITDPTRTNADRGINAGFSVQVPLKKETSSVFAIDYAFRPMDNFSNVHS